MADSTIHAVDPTPTTPLVPTAPDHESAPSPIVTPYEVPFPKYEEPLYTEINIPLPRIKSPPPSTPLSPSPRGRSRSIAFSSLSPFRRSSTSTARTSGERSRNSEEWPRVRRDIVKSKEVAAAMNLGHVNKRTRSGTVDALAVVPALLMLSAELFTPGQDARGRKDSGVGKWEDGIR